MALSFGRSVSFPLTPARSTSKPRHVRSVSLPCATSSHPLHAHIAALRAWTHTDSDSSSLRAGLAAIHALHAALADVLLLPESRQATTYAADRLLDAFLLLADAHQGFQECLLSLRHAATESRASLRRGDTGRLASAARSQRRAEKELARLAASVSTISSKSARLNLVVVSGEEAESEMAYALVEAAAASAMASAAVFSAAASMSSTASSSKKTVTFLPSFARRAATAPETREAIVDRLHALEQCLDECDGVCYMVLRSIVQNRVSLLNIMTPTI